MDARAKESQFLLLVGACVVVALAAVLNYGLPTADQADEELKFVAMSVLMVILCAMELISIRAVLGGLWLLAPGCLAVIGTFAIPFGLTSLEYAFPEGAIERRPYAHSYMTQGVFLAMVGCFAMCRGFAMAYARDFGAAVGARLEKSGIITGENQFRPYAIFVLLAVSYAARLIQIRLGVYGYAADVSQMEELADYRQFFSYGARMGEVALLALALQYFGGNARTKGSVVLLGAVTVVEVLFGILSGFKSLMIFPAVLLAAASYASSGRIPWRMFLIACLLVPVSYMVIEPFRAFRGQDASMSVRSVEGLAGIVGGGITAYGGDEDESPGAILLRVTARLRMTEVTARCIEFADQFEGTDAIPEFGSSVLMAPALALVPRILWPSKPAEDFGQWATQNVMGVVDDDQTSVGIGGTAYLYLMGGIAMVFAGFFVIGLVQRITYEALIAQRRIGGAIVYFGIATTLSLVDLVHTQIVSLIRNIPIFLVVQLLILKDGSSSRRASGAKGGSMTGRIPAARLGGR